MDERTTLKDVELQQYYDRLFGLFATDEWKEFTTEVTRFKDGRPTLEQLPDARALHFVQGQMDILKWVLGFEQRTRDVYDSVLADEQKPAADLEDDEWL